MSTKSLQGRRTTRSVNDASLHRANVAWDNSFRLNFVAAGEKVSDRYNILSCVTIVIHMRPASFVVLAENVVK